MTNPYEGPGGEPGAGLPGAGPPTPWEQRWVGPAWGPPGSPPLAWGYQPIDPYELAMGGRRKAFRRGLLSVLLVPLGFAVGLFGLVTLFFGFGAFFVLGGLLCFGFAFALALGSVIELWRYPVEGHSRVPPMIPALVTLAAIGTYVVLVAIDVASG